MEGAIAALRETRSPRELVLVTPALTPDSRRALSEGFITLVSDTPLEKLCRELFLRVSQAVHQVGGEGDQGQALFCRLICMFLNQLDQLKVTPLQRR
jgi:LacI family transcriptional regulator